MEDEADLSTYTAEQLAAFKKHQNAWVKVYKNIDVVFAKEMLEIGDISPNKNVRFWGMKIDTAKEIAANEKDMFKVGLLQQVSLIVHLYYEQKNEVVKPDLTVEELITANDLSFKKLLSSDDPHDNKFITDIAELCVAAKEYTEKLAIKPL